MAKFGRTSQERLDTCHQDWHMILNYVVRFFDCSILEGHRGLEKQNFYFQKGTSKVKFPNSTHNTEPSLGIDVCPYPEIYNDKEKCCMLAGWIMAVSRMLYEQGKITHMVRWGGDWNMNNNLKDQGFFDLVHFELIIAL